MTEKPHPFYHNEAIDLTDDPGLPNSRAIAIGLSRISEQLDFLIDLLQEEDLKLDLEPEENVQVRLPTEHEPWDYVGRDSSGLADRTGTSTRSR